MVKSGMTAALASSVAALAASAAKAKPSRQVKSANNKPPAAGGGARGRVKLDPDQENASSKTMSKEHRKLVADNEGGGEDAPAVLATDQTKVLVSGLGADTAAEDLEDAFSDAGPVRHIKVAKGGKATVYFVLATDAARCVKDLQGLEIAGNPLKLMLGESEEAVTAAGAADDKLSDKPLPQYTKLNTRLFRLVVRNLPFGIKEAAVRSAFEAFGTLEEVHLPLICGRDGKDQTRGFGFLQYSSRTEAKKALDDGNGMELLGRKVAVDWAVAKEIYQEMVPQKANQTPNAKDSDASAPPDATKRKQPDDAAAADDGKGKKKKAEGEEKQAELARTVFIRNVPLESEEQELREVMRRFGKMVSCKLVIDKVTGKHKGTGFCQFVSASSAQAACEAGGAFTGTDSWEEVQRKKDKRLQGSAVRGVLDDFNETLSMNGRHLFVALAVDRTKVDTLEAKEKLDPRNLHLSKEGVILEDSPEAKNMPPQDLAKRLRDWQEKKTKLANSNFSVNRTRLSVRNIGKGLGEVGLKDLFYNTVVQAIAGKDERGVGEASGKRSKDKAVAAHLVGPVKVIGANLVRDKTKIDPKSGKPLTKGYGFVEFTEHAHALVALRRLNNCAATAKKHNFGKRLMIDFALDDARVVRLRRIKQVRVERAKHRRAEAAKEEQATEEAEHGKRLGRGALQRLKKRQRPEDADDDNAGKGQSAKKAKGTGAEDGKGKVKWGTAEESEGKTPKDFSKPYRERGNKMDGVVRPGAGRRALAPADPRGAKAAAAAEAGRGNKNNGAAAKAKAAAQLNDQHLASIVAEVGDVMPKTKKSKKNKDKEDGLDKLVQQYTSTLFKSGQSEGRWFD